MKTLAQAEFSIWVDDWCSFYHPIHDRWYLFYRSGEMWWLHKKDIYGSYLACQRALVYLFLLVYTSRLAQEEIVAELADFSREGQLPRCFTLCFDLEYESNKHEETCNNEKIACIERRAAFEKQYPKYCRVCDAKGTVFEEYDEEEHSCFACIEKYMCPRCMRKTLVEDEDSGFFEETSQRCFVCDWQSVQEEQGLPELWICVCAARQQ